MTDNTGTGVSIIVKTVTRIVTVPMLIFGIYIILNGHLSPGGGFAGGVMVALCFVLLMLAFGKVAAISRISRNLASNLEGIGALMFLSIAVIGYFGGSFFLNLFSKGKPFEIFSAGTIIFSNIATGIKVGVGLLAIFLALVILEGTKTKK